MSTPIIPVPDDGRITILAQVGSATYVLGSIEPRPDEGGEEVCTRMIRLLRHLAHQATLSARFGELHFADYDS